MTQKKMSILFKPSFLFSTFFCSVFNVQFKREEIHKEIQREGQSVTVYHLQYLRVQYKVYVQSSVILVKSKNVKFEP